MLNKLIKRLNNTADSDLIMFGNYIKVLFAYHDITKETYETLYNLLENRIGNTLYFK